VLIQLCTWATEI